MGNEILAGHPPDAQSQAFSRARYTRCARDDKIELGRNFHHHELKDLCSGRWGVMNHARTNSSISYLVSPTRKGALV